jgi:hypothetical protein
VSEVSPGHLKFKFQLLLKKCFYWPPTDQLYGPLNLGPPADLLDPNFMTGDRSEWILGDCIGLSIPTKKIDKSFIPQNHHKGRFVILLPLSALCNCFDISFLQLRPAVPTKGRLSGSRPLFVVLLLLAAAAIQEPKWLQMPKLDCNKLKFSGVTFFRY